MNSAKVLSSHSDFNIANAKSNRIMESRDLLRSYHQVLILKVLSYLICSHHHVLDTDM